MAAPPWLPRHNRFAADPVGHVRHSSARYGGGLRQRSQDNLIQDADLTHALMQPPLAHPTKTTPIAIPAVCQVINRSSCPPKFISLIRPIATLLYMALWYLVLLFT
jgi:small neutral amino acid transporter SnatA (MarC family)